MNGNELYDQERRSESNETESSTQPQPRFQPALRIPKRFPGESQRSPERVERVALFIDGINLWYAQQKLNYRIDYLKLRDYWIRKPGQELYNAFFYTGIMRNPRRKSSSFSICWSITISRFARRPSRPFTIPC
jgi:hypothetical protein